MKLTNPFKASRDFKAAHALYAETLLAARQPVLFTDWGVPDTPEGRFEALAVIAFLVLRRFKDIDAGAGVSQAYFDIMFADIDSNLRELGVSDAAVGKRVKKLAASFYGRIRAYERALEDAEAGTLEDALGRFLFRDADPRPESLARAGAYVRAQDAFLAAQENTRLKRGEIVFGPAAAA